MDLLRFATAGSVDDGKSTLIGRLLYDSKSIFEDQLIAVEESSRRRGDAVVNLAGATTGKLPWTKKYKDELIWSRVRATELLVNAMHEAKKPPKVFVSGSASGIYGDTGDAVLTEEAPKGTGFLSDLAFEWEQAALKAIRA